LEALAPNKTDIISLDHSWSCAFMKIYRAFDKEIVKQCLFYTGTLTIKHYYTLRYMSFLLNLDYSNNSLLQFLTDVNGQNDIINLAIKYNTTYENFGNIEILSLPDTAVAVV